MIKEKYDWVKSQLTTHPALRDSNERLYYNYLKHIGYNTNKTVRELLIDMQERVIPYIDVIGRASRKVQEENPHLRGKYYGKRKSKKEPEVRKEIRDLS